MSIIPSFLRRKDRSSKTSRKQFRCESLESRRMLALTITAGDHVLLPNTPNQVIEIMATNTLGEPADNVTGVIFQGQLGDGDGGTAEPSFGGLDFNTDTIWTARSPDTFLPDHDPFDPSTAIAGLDGSYVVSGVVMGNGSGSATDPAACGGGICDFAPNGVVARLIIDTTGFTSGTFPLLLTDDVGMTFDPEPTTFTDSSLTEIQLIDLSGGNGTFQLEHSQNGTTVVSDPIDHPLSHTSSATDVADAIMDMGGGGIFEEVEVTLIAQSVWEVRIVKFFDFNNFSIVNNTTGVAGSVSEIQAGGIGGPVPTTVVNGSITIEDPATSVEARHIFYDNSFYDSNPLFGFPDDDSAIDDLKSPLTPGGIADFSNYIGRSAGITGIMVDIAGNIDAASITDLGQLAANFDFTVNTSNFSLAPNPSFDTLPQAAAPSPSAITVRPGDGDNGSNRISIFWNPGSIRQQWLRVTVRASAATGLPTDDVFYFGSAIGETGNSATNAIVNGSDFAGARDNPHTNIFDRAPVNDAYDFNKDSSVNGTDLGVARDNFTNTFDALKLITAPSSLGKTGLVSEGEAEFGSLSSEPQATLSDALEIIAALRRKAQSSGPEANAVDLALDFNGDLDVTINDALAIIAELRLTQDYRQPLTDPILTVDRFDSLDIDLLEV